MQFQLPELPKNNLVRFGEWATPLKKEIEKHFKSMMPDDEHEPWVTIKVEKREILADVWQIVRGTQMQLLTPISLGLLPESHDVAKLPECVATQFDGRAIVVIGPKQIVQQLNSLLEDHTKLHKAISELWRKYA